MAYSVTYELVQVAQRWGTWEHFDALDSDTQALLVAHYRTSQRFQAVDYWANRPKQKPDTHAASRRPARRRRR